MNKRYYKLVVYLIGVTVVTIIGVQLYWIYKEYQLNKQNLISKVQLSLDNSVEAYFVNLTKSGIITFTSIDSASAKKKIDTIFLKPGSRFGLRKKIDSTLQNIAKTENKKPLLLKNRRDGNFPFFTANKHFPKSIDSLISKVFISISRDTLDLKKLSNYVNNELSRNNINVTYGLQYSYYKGHFKNKKKPKVTTFHLNNFPKKYLKTVSKSTFLPHRSKLELFFTDETPILLKESLISILLSLLLSLSIIASLLYLLKTIYKQKQLSEVKNDLISNITHEFKTPIATISAALEAMKSFNVLNDKEKSEKYINIANAQIKKLDVMIEKILETATLNHEELKITKKPVNISELINEIITKYQLLSKGKTILFKSTIPNKLIKLDAFHFENAISNIFDNAIKYGGNNIETELTSDKNTITLTISDDGNGIPKNQKDKIFEQFYRIPTGNTHAVKGFGIGLYYTKNIIEKHGGTIQVIYNKKNKTTFKIELPNE
ncbi:HAMP domain-containing sensor histidine kinase [Lutibacter sp.]|uniref:sensor histidine kinase n=1 Tax=Lutibacter sp. TaxID=1925666 RepID=UPI0025C43EBD|nr:HAMP domain-containing sensor histidine kinase [Lutibacter sp.]MCF6182135.1 HAMP domain-containing histidine kinase [Lutibacter sp.]